MKGVILAGGLGTRLYPLTHATSKQLLPIYDKPMIYYPIQTLVRAGVDDIMVVTGGPHAGDFIRVLRNGRQFGVRHLEYTYQENPEGGLAQGLGLCEEFIGDDSVAFILGDNTTDAAIGPAIERFRGGAMVFLKPVPDPERFGCPVFAYIRTITPSARGQLEITDANNCYLRDGKLAWEELDGYWSDAGTVESLYGANNYWAENALGKAFQA